MMKKNLINPLKALVLAVVTVGLVFVTSCGDDEEPAPTETIMQIVQNTEDLDSLQKYLEVYPDLVATLGSAGGFTLFAPTNSAFISLLQTEGFPSDITSINPDIIKNVLAYHLSITRYESGDLPAGTEVSTQGVSIVDGSAEQIIVNDDGTLFTGSSTENILILDADIKATNGVIHTVGSVLIPFSVGAVLTPNLGKTSGAILLGSNFSILATALNAAEAYAATSEQIPSLLAVLAGTNAHTMFAPTNATFETAADSPDYGGNGDGSASASELNTFLGLFSNQQFYGIVATHIVASTIIAGDLTLDASFTSLSQAPLTVVKTDLPTAPPLINTGIGIDSDVDGTYNAQVAVPAAASPDNLVTSNGRIHVIAGLLLPPQPQ